MFLAQQRQTRFSGESVELATIPVEQGVVLFDHEHGVAAACGVLHEVAQAGGASVEFVAIPLIRVVDGGRHVRASPAEQGLHVYMVRGAIGYW